MTDFFCSFLNQIFLFFPLAFAVCIGFGSLNAVDLTLDGSFVFGAGVFAKVSTAYPSSFVLPLALAVLAGALCGVLASLLQYQQKIDALLAGILASFILLSSILLVMGRPNISVFNNRMLLNNDWVQTPQQQTLTLGVCVVLVLFFVYGILQKHYGLFLRAVGDNPLLFARLGKSLSTYRTLGFATTNALAAVSGCLTAQINGFADTSMSVGVTITAMGAVILGHELLRAFSKRLYLRLTGELTATILGVVIYFTFLNGLLFLGVQPLYLKLIIACLVVGFLRYSNRGRGKTA